MKITILAKVKDGKLKVNPFFLPDFGKLEGKDVEIKSIEETRNSQQNRYLWGVVYRLASEHTGFTPEEVHEVFKKRYLGYKKNGYEFTKSTTDLTISEFSEYVNKVKDYCASELGLVIPDSDLYTGK